MKPIKSNKSVHFILIVLLLSLFLALCIWAFPWIMSFSKEEVRLQFENYIESLGWSGVLVFIFFQLLQIVIAFIPGEPIELAAGVLYGPVWGTILCMIGSLIGTVIVFYIVKAFGNTAALVFFKEKELSKIKFLQNTKKLKFVLFILFFIPGTPKDILTYFAPLTPIRPGAFFLIATFARFPSIITSTLAGASITDGEFTKGIIIFLITALIGLLGILFYNKFIEKHNDTPKKTGE